MSRKNLITHIIDVCADNGVQIVFEPYEKLKNDACVGLFDDEEKLIRVATKSGRWLTVLTHEFSHLLQNIDNKWTSEEDLSKFEDLWGLIEGERKLSIGKRRDCCFTAQLCEWDCERRTIDLLKKYRTGIPTEQYAKQANAYIYFYSYIYETSKWYIKSPTLVQEIIDIMPAKLIAEPRSILYMPEGYKELVEKHCM